MNDRHVAKEINNQQEICFPF